MTTIKQVEVVSERKNIKKIIFKGSILYIIWDNGTASKYQYNWIRNIEDVNSANKILNPLPK